MTRVWNRLGSFGVLVAMCTVAGRAQAEESAPPSAAAVPATATTAVVAVSAPDIVRLKNGAIYRGTIAELVPGEYVTIVLITGESRKFPIAEVRRAGSASSPANADPLPASVPPPPAKAAFDENESDDVAPPSDPESARLRPYTVVHAAKARVRVVSEPKGSTLFRRSASAGYGGAGYVSGYEEVCTAPCVVTLPAGTHTFAVAKRDGAPRQAPAVDVPAGDSTLRLGIISRSGIRWGIRLGGVASVGLGVALAATSKSDGEQVNAAQLAIGLTLASLGLSAFSTSFIIPDGARVVVTPGVLPKASREGAGPRSELAALRDGLSGLTFTARF